MIHHLTHPGELTASAVVCGDPAAAVATWDTQRVTCRECLGKTLGDAHGVPGPRATPMESLVLRPVSCANDQGPRTKDNRASPVGVARGRRTTERPGEPSRGHKRPQAPGLQERQLQEAIRQACALQGWVYYHTKDSRHSPAGYPDVTAVRGPRLVFAELKRQGATPTPAQQQWLDALGHVQRVETYLWTTVDLDQALEVLR